MNQLDVEEMEILEAFESGQLKRVENLNEEINRHRKSAAATFQEDIPYQTFVASVLHKFVEGKLVEDTANDLND